VVCCGTITVAGESVTIPLLRHLAAIDTPDQHSSHTIPTPRDGCLPVVAVLAVYLASPAAPGIPQ
jgi:hypothetical protein